MIGGRPARAVYRVYGEDEFLGDLAAGVRCDRRASELAERSSHRLVCFTLLAGAIGAVGSVMIGSGALFQTTAGREALTAGRKAQSAGRKAEQARRAQTRSIGAAAPSASLGRVVAATPARSQRDLEKVARRAPWAARGLGATRPRRARLELALVAITGARPLASPHLVDRVPVAEDHVPIAGPAAVVTGPAAAPAASSVAGGSAQSPQRGGVEFGFER